MDIVWIIVGALLIVIGFIGCIIPVIPGPGLAYIGLLVTQLKEAAAFSTRFMIIWAVIIIGTAALDYLVTPLATKKFGGSRKGVIGSMVGLILGMLLFPPIGFIIGPLIGALIGEIIDGKSFRESTKAALGALVGFVTGSLLKITVVIVMGYYFVLNNF